MKYFCFCKLFCLLIVGLSGCKPDVEIIAHRGASYLAPENTMASVLLGWEKGADVVEIDVYLSKDNRIVVIHDKTTKRTTGVEMKISQTTSEQLRKLDVGHFKEENFVGQRIPFLEEIIETIPLKRKLFVEIKCGKEILPFLEQVITASGKMSQIVIIGFDIETMAAFKELMPRIPVYWVYGTVLDEKTKRPIPHDTKLIQIARENGLDGLDVHYAGVTENFADAIKASGQKFYVWTVNDVQEAMRLCKLGVNGITTNRPGWLREQLRHYEK